MTDMTNTFAATAPLGSGGSGALGWLIRIGKAKIVEQWDMLWLNKQMHRHFFIILIAVFTAFFSLQVLE